MGKWDARARVVLDLVGAKGEERERLLPVVHHLLALLSAALLSIRVHR